MGCVCCCLHMEDFEDYVSPNSSVHRDCIGIRWFVHNFANLYISLFQRGEVHTPPSPVPGESPLSSQAIPTLPSDSTMDDTFHPPPRPLPYNADPRCSGLQQEGLISRSEKASSHCHVESEPLRSRGAAGLDSLRAEGKWNGSDGYVGGSKACKQSGVMVPPAKVFGEEAYFLTSSEDEDVCPTCLEDYTPDNPKIVTQCSHHYHLGCIYEWMERSETCPVCGKVMEFDETT